MLLLLCVYFWDGLVFFVVFFSLLGLWEFFFVCFVVGVMVIYFFFHLAKLFSKESNLYAWHL